MYIKYINVYEYNIKVYIYQHKWMYKIWYVLYMNIYIKVYVYQHILMYKKYTIYRIYML